MDAQLKPPVITRDYLLSLITTTTFSRKDTTTTCKLDIGGFPIKGESHCAYRVDFNQAIGEKVAYENALKTLHDYEAYHARKKCEELRKLAGE